MIVFIMVGGSMCKRNCELNAKHLQADASCQVLDLEFSKGTNPTTHLWGPRLKSEQALYGLSPPKLAPEGIEPETSGGANSKIPSQPLDQPQMG
ncbi:hypothetical protein MTR_3g090090 [Medicago truncatula]|uniref:Uncharacterized protein n=1 Tax=Medicago truncatula TaxID=3880 RepID=G7J652_MEDTR|nr:hypothetical protein MTR_3g090090 [Medicago truncatula]